MPEALQYETLLICEGREERAFAEAMIAGNRAPAMDLRVIGENGRGNGITGLRAFLQTMRGLTNFSNIRRIGIFADNDDDPAARLSGIRADISAANASPDINGRLSLPNASHQTADDAEISVRLILSPGSGRTGCLETLLLAALYQIYPNPMSCVDGLVKCAGLQSGPDQWSQGKVDKAKVRTAIAIINKTAPSLPLTLLWKNRPDLIPVNHATFNDLSAEMYAI